MINPVIRREPGENGSMIVAVSRSKKEISANLLVALGGLNG